MKKKDAQFFHAKKRFKERYGEDITDAQLKELISDIQKGYCQHISSMSNRVTVFKSGEWVFLYDNKRKSIVTFITEDMIPHYVQNENRAKLYHVKPDTIMTPDNQKKLYDELLSKWSK